MSRLVSVCRRAIVTSKPESALSHCPEQSYLTISGRCIYDRKLCPVPKLNADAKVPDKILQLVEEAKSTGQLGAISRAGVVDKPPEA